MPCNDAYTYVHYDTTIIMIYVRIPSTNPIRHSGFVHYTYLSRNYQTPNDHRCYHGYCVPLDELLLGDYQAFLMEDITP